MTTVFENVIFAGSWCVSVVAWLVAFDLLSRSERRRPRLALVAAGLAAGTAVWAQPSLASDWPAGAGFAPQLIIISLLIAIGATTLGLAVERKFADVRGLISGAAILGGGIALSHGAMMLGLTGPHALDFEDVPVATATALTTPLAVGAVLLRRRIAGPLGQIAAAVCLTAGAAVSHAADLAALTTATDGAPFLGEGSVDAARMAPAAGVLMIALMLSLRLLGETPAIRRATRAPAWRGSPRPSPALRRVGTASPRPGTGR